MFALDLFNNDHERRLAEGAVDQLEQRRIDDLAMKMDELVARAKTATTPEAKSALVKEFQKCKAERDGYFKIKDECMGYGSLGEADQVPAPTQPVRAGTDLVTPQQRVAGATPPSNTALGKAKETFTSFANWLAGKDDVGPTYESAVKEQTSAISPVTAAKYAYEQMRKAHDDNVDIATVRWMNTAEPITMSRNQIYHTLTRLKNMSRQNRNQFALQTLANRNNFALWLGGQKKVQTRPPLKQPSDPFQPNLTGFAEPKIGPVSERAQKKNSDDPKFGDAEIANTVRKIRAKHPAARSDLEALAKDELDHQARSDQQLAAIKGANTKQDELLKQLVSLDQEQGREIDGLDSENNSLEAQLARIQATNDRLQTTIQSMTGTKQSTRSKQTARAEPQTKTTEPTLAPVIAVDPAVEKKLQGLEAQLSKLEKQPQSADVKKQITDLENRINALPAQAAQALNIDQDDSTVAKKQYRSPRVQAPLGDLDIQPPKSKVKVKPKTTATPPKSNAPKATPVPNPEDEFDLLNIDESVNKLHQGDPIVVTAPNEFEGKTGEIYDFSPSGTFVIVDLYNHGKHSMHLSDVKYNDYADQEEENDWYDEEVNESNMSELDAMRQDLELMNDRQFLSAYGISKAAFQQKYRTLLNPADLQDTPVEEGFVPLGKYSPTYVCLAGKPVKKFDYYEDAERFHNNWKQKLYREGNKEKADKITLLDATDEAAKKGLYYYVNKRKAAGTSRSKNNPKAPTAQAWKDAAKTAKKEDVAESDDPAVAARKLKSAQDTARYIVRNLDDRHALKQYAPNTWSPERFYQGATAAMRGANFDEIVKIVYQDEPGWFPKPQYEAKADTTGSWVVYNDSKVKRFKTHSGATAYAEKNGGKVASSEFYQDKIQKQGVSEAFENGSKVQHPKYGAGQVYKVYPNGMISVNFPEYLDPMSKNPGITGNFNPGDSDYQSLKEAETDYQKRRQRERDVDAGRPVKPVPKNPQTDYARKRAQDKRDMELGEGADLINMSDLQFFKELLGVMVIPVAAFGAMAWNKAMNAIKLYRAEDVITALQKKGVTVDHGTFEQIKPLLLKLEQAIDVDKDGDTAKELAKRIQQTVTWGKLKQANPKTDAQPTDNKLGENLMKEPANRKEYLDQRDKLFRMLSVESDSASKQIIKQAIKDLDARYGSAKDPVKEESSTSSEAVEIAIIRRILVAHTDLIMEFGLDKVTQAIEEVAYNVGDVDEIGTSDVSAYVNQVKQILGVPKELDEKWSQKYKSSINCANPKGFSQKAHCAGKKK
jgi:hypothetical protein